MYKKAFQLQNYLDQRDHCDRTRTKYFYQIRHAFSTLSKVEQRMLLLISLPNRHPARRRLQRPHDERMSEIVITRALDRILQRIPEIHKKMESETRAGRPYLLQNEGRTRPLTCKECRG